MEDQYWKECQYYVDGNLPDELKILLDRAYLIPHLLDSSEIKAAREVCKYCKQQERRSSYRVNRPLAVVLRNQQTNARVEGTVINASASGALIKLKEWIDFGNSEVVEVEFYSAANSPAQSRRSVMRGSGVIKRKSRKKRQMAMMLLSNASRD
jgi:hypothetical protein